MAAVSAIRQYPQQPFFGMQAVSRSGEPRGESKTDSHGRDGVQSQAGDKFVGHRDTGVNIDDLPLGRRICSKMIRWYQENKTFHGGKMTFHCTYPEKAKRLGHDVPSCSQYTLEAIQKRGVIIGILLGMGRIMNCNPISQKIPFLKDRFVEVKSK